MLGIDIQQILLHMLNFVILFGALYFLLYNPVKKFMDKRSEIYSEEECRAATGLEEAEKLKAEYKAKLAQAEDEIKELKAKASSEARSEADRIKQNAQQEADEIVSKAKTKANKEIDSIVRSANKEIRLLAEEAAEKLVIDGEDAYTSFIESLGSEEN